MIKELFDEGMRLKDIHRLKGEWKMIKRKGAAVMMSIAITGLLVFAGCSAETPQEPTTGAPTETPTQGIVVNDIKFDTIEPDQLDGTILNELDQLKTQRGFFVWPSEQGGYYVMLASGLKPTGGYDIGVEFVKDNEGMTQISVVETSPGPDDMVTEALTYPFEVIYIEGVTDRFTVQNQNDESFELLMLDEENYTSVVGTYVGQIDNNSIEVTVDDGFMVFRNHIMTEMVADIELGDEVEIIYNESEDGQLWLVKINMVR